MNLLSHLQDQFRHMEWADAVVWQTALSVDAALADETLRARLHHIHLVQRVFLAVWQGEFANYQDGHERQQAVLAWVNKGGDLRGADLQGAILHGANFYATIFDDTTVLPDGQYWSVTLDLAHYTDPAHPEFWTVT